jgi:hypothetical protein
VLAHLFRKRQMACLPADGTPQDVLKVTAVEMFSVKGSMLVSSSSSRRSANVDQVC